ncbi:hypothetical protein ARTSIC4J27_2632 [Pseudarthrobacter siccitolerans]|uniref:Uncharacterized protein n=1 Tax=Pseudarthrobacter siccitolerans TaxID=861266 RepID=A0A024H440_9MICC|nr:hypothetical protein ARTSIC4J27_2632 [Pseudarthrobacter siccitolerans]
MQKVAKADDASGQQGFEPVNMLIRTHPPHFAPPHGAGSK